MKAFMDKDFLLSTETSKKLFHEYAETMPIVITIAISIPRKLQRIVSLRILPRCGLVAIIINGVR